MAILRGNARLLLAEHRRRPFGGSLLTLGRQLIFFTPAELTRWARLHGVELAPAGVPTLSHDPRLARQGCMDDRTFFRALGFMEVTSLDLSAYEGAEVLADLNEPLPAPLRGRFDAVLEAGTLQHVFHLPQVLANIHWALKVGGRAIFAWTTSHNHVDHGFYSFSPTLFADFYAANGYRLETLHYFEFGRVWLGGRLAASPFTVYAYTPGCLDHLSYGGMGRRQGGIFAVATRLAGSSGDRVPQQGAYAALWRDPGRLGRGPVAAGEGRRSRLERRVAEAGARYPALLVAALAAKRLLALPRRLHRRMPPVVARY